MMILALIPGIGVQARRGILAAGLLMLGSVVAACGGGGNATRSGSADAGGGGAPQGHVAVVAAENFWGSLVAQLGGGAVEVVSVVTDPNADPHEYETSTDDARAFANADYVVQNGAGYDNWAARLLSANAHDGRMVLTVAELLGSRTGDNPHFWYSPVSVERVADRITADLKARDAADSAYLDARRAAFQRALAPYRARIADIRARFSGVPVAATENIVVSLCDALGLSLISPPRFMQAVAEGNDPPAGTVAEFQQQLGGRQARVLIYNAQTVTAVTTNLRKVAESQGIPTVAVTETIVPDGTSFQDWQLAQLNALAAALGGGGGTASGAAGSRSTPAASP